MADEQPIYVSPQEELTSVLERLARTQARHITLVIPAQTQLHSHTGWRLIHARMREMGKELLVISPDRQVQALASAAGFKVAARQDGASGSPTRSGSRPGTNPRNGSRPRVGGSRGGSESQSTQQRRPTPLSSKRPQQPLPPIQGDFEDESTLERPGKRRSKPRPSQPIPPVMPLRPPESKFGASYDFPIDTTPSLRPSSPAFEEDDDDDVFRHKADDDYQAAQDIRASASKGPVKPTEKNAPTNRRKTDPYAHLEDDQPHSRLPEQRGALRSPVDELGTDVPDLADYSTEIMPGEIEDLGDQGALDLPISKLEREQPAPREREQGLRPRARTGQMQPSTRHSPRAPRPGSQDFEDDDDLLALPERGSQPPRTSRGMGGSAGLAPSRGQANSQQPRPSQALRPSDAMPRPSQNLKPTGANPQAGSRRPASAPAPVAATSQRAPSRQLMSRPAPTQSGRQASRPQGGPRRGNGGLKIFFGVVLLLLCVALALFYFVPTATVTISLRAQTFSQTVHLTAMTNPQANMPGVVAATKLQANFSANGQQKATGSVPFGNAQAQGLVTFTNNGKADVTIPTGTIVKTQSGLAFVTGAEAVIPYGGNVPAVPVTAQQSGNSGNVPANSITAIPTGSVSSIAQYNKVSPASINLTVNNPQATSGGGTINEPAVTNSDLQALKQTLHQKLQQQLTAWLNLRTHSGDVRGTTVPDVLGSSSPTSTEQLSGAPAVNQAVSSGTFSGTLSVHISVLVVRASDLQKAAGTQLNTAALEQNPPSVLATQLPVTLASEQGKLSADGNSLSITAQASGSTIRQISTQLLSNSLTGKGITQAQSELQASMARVGFLGAKISVSPGFFTSLPLIAGHIQIILKPLQPTPPKHVPNG